MIWFGGFLARSSDPYYSKGKHKIEYEDSPGDSGGGGAGNTHAEPNKLIQEWEMRDALGTILYLHF